MRLFNICFMLSIVPVDWVIACMVPLYKGKGDMYECSNFRGINLLRVVGKVYGRVLINTFTTARRELASNGHPTQTTARRELASSVHFLKKNSA